MHTGLKLQTSDITEVFRAEASLLDDMLVFSPKYDDSLCFFFNAIYSETGEYRQV